LFKGQKCRFAYTRFLAFVAINAPDWGWPEAVTSTHVSSSRSDKECFLDLLDLFQKYWPILALCLWFAYKWWNSKRIVAMLPELKKKGATFVDVRSAGEFSNANAPGTINIPLQELGSRLGEIPKSAPVVLCCASGTRSGMAKMLLKKNGYREVYNIGTWGKFLA
jgi:phage shock protein E